MIRVSKESNPSRSLRIIEVDTMRDLAARTKAAIEAVDAGDKADIESSFQTWINFHGLTWPSCVESLDSRLAIDLRDSE
jgi:hypothetical protein